MLNQILEEIAKSIFEKYTLFHSYSAGVLQVQDGQVIKDFREYAGIKDSNYFYIRWQGEQRYLDTKDRNSACVGFDSEAECHLVFMTHGVNQEQLIYNTLHDLNIKAPYKVTVLSSSVNFEKIFEEETLNKPFGELQLTKINFKVKYSFLLKENCINRELCQC